jgi:hypothetical protein
MTQVSLHYLSNDLGGLTVSLPPSLLAHVGSVPECPDPLSITAGRSPIGRTSHTTHGTTAPKENR